MAEARRYHMDIARGKKPEEFPKIIAEMKKAGFVFTEKPQGWPLPLKEPFHMRAYPASAGGGHVVYSQTDG